MADTCDHPRCDHGVDEFDGPVESNLDNVEGTFCGHPCREDAEIGAHKTPHDRAMDRAHDFEKAML